MTRERNDNRSGQRGDNYQALVAIKYALEYTEKPFESLTLEHNGDITFDTYQQIEVKHHSPKISLGDYHIDFWNTLYNWCIKGNDYEKLILHTTAYFPKTKSSLRTWEKQSMDQRYDTIKNIINSNTASGVSEYMSYINSLGCDKLKPILSKIEIKVDQLIDTDLVNQLILNPTIQSISCKVNDRPKLINERLGGFIKGKVIGEKRWKISYVQLITILQEIGKNFLDENYSPIFEKYFSRNMDEADYYKFSEKRFVNELTKINCDADEVRDAINDYWKTNSSIAEEIERNPTFDELEFQPYKKEKVYKSLVRKKRMIKMDKGNNSLYFYRSAMEMNLGISGKIPDYQYFKHGTMQIVVEDGELEFSWLYE